MTDDVIINGVRYVPAMLAETADLSHFANQMWGGVPGRAVRFLFIRGGSGFFTDSAMSIAAPNPVVADANGRFPQVWTDAISVEAGFIDEHGVLQQALEITNPFWSLSDSDTRPKAGDAKQGSTCE